MSTETHGSFAFERPATSRGGQIVVRKYFPNLVLAFIAFLLIFLSFKTGLDAGMASERIEPSWRYRLFGIPIVLSQIYYGRPYDYVGYKTIEGYFEPENASIDDLVVRLKSVPNVDAGGPFFILADDKGIVDFVRLAFRLYGIRTASLYYLYFTIFLTSSALFVAAYFGDRHKLALLVFLTVALHATMPAFIVFRPGINILDIHAFGILTLPAVLHILVSATERHLHRLTLITIVLQALILALNHHIRSSSLSQTIVIVCGYPILVLLSAGTEPSRWSGAAAWLRSVVSRRMLPVAILLIVLGLLPVYQRVMYNPGYFGRRAMVGRPFYHNLLIGMGFNPFLQQRYALGLGDLGAANAVDAFIQSKGRHLDNPHWAAGGLNTTTTQLPFDWVEYEEAAGELYWTIWREHPRESLRALAYYHPLDLYQIVRSYSVSADPTHGAEPPYRPFRPGYVAVIAAVTLLCTTVRPLAPVHVVVGLIMLVSPLIPAILVYAGGFIIVAEGFVSAAFLGYTIFSALLSWLVHRTMGMLRTQEAAPAPIPKSRIV